MHKSTGIPLYHLDMMNWNTDKTTVPKHIFQERLQKAMAQDSWIIDGNYGSTIELRLKACDTVFFLDYSLEVCLNGIKIRKGQIRSDMPWIEAIDDNDEEFLEFIRNYNLVNRPTVIELLEKYYTKNIFIFKSRNDADQYLSLLNKKSRLLL